MAKQVTVLTNSFHGTEFRTTKSEAEIQRCREHGLASLSSCERAWVRKVWSVLCGCPSCSCGNNLGERDI
jgi:hypothetical protein